MKVLFIDWACFGRSDVLDALKELGYEVYLFPVRDELRTLGFRTGYIDEVTEKLRSEQISFVFSLNYFPNISEACQQYGCKYISWIYDSPYNKVHSINIINTCNVIFTFDRQMYQKLRRQFVNTVYYAPLAANVRRLSRIRLSPSEWKKYASDISFVGALYDEKNNNYEELLTILNHIKDYRTIGFINALIETQRKIYGCHFLGDALGENPSILKTLPESLNDTNTDSLHFMTLPDSYADHILCRKITSLERKEMLTVLSSYFPTKLYTSNPNAEAGSCKNCGYASYMDVMPKVFKASKINLNITLRSIQTGIPLRAFDIMGAGGFLLTNYQENFLLHFEPDVDFVFYSSREELLEKAAYYLAHDKERQKIADNGYQKVAKNHTYTKQIAQMTAIAFS